MKTRNSHHIVFLGDLQDHSTREACWGAGEYAAGCPDLVFDPWPVPEMQRYFRSHAHLPPWREFKAADGLLVTEQGAEAIRRAYGAMPCPHVFYLSNSRHRRTSGVAVDEAALAIMAADHLLQRGYGHLAFVGNRGKPWSELRARAFARHGRAAGAAVAVFEFDEKVLPAYLGAGLRERHRGLDGMFERLRWPCGVAATSDIVAFFVLEAARRRGLRVPQEMAVIGVDNDPLPSVASGMAISTVVVPFRKVGWEAARLLHQRLRGDSQPHWVTLPPTRVEVRTSTDCFRVADPVVQRAQAWIENRRQGRLKVGEVARAVGVSRMTLIEKFRRHLRTGVHAYILRRRIEYARDLLRGDDLNVDQTAAACGFSSTVYFCRVFRRVTGATPGRVRLGARGTPSPPKSSHAARSCGRTVGR
ncbi:MAG: substrate-binding domain-containing protein [Acidobacteria bacterium]|nr:substrate-binding domain-containing protein [Acidobacteriota bacterium]